MAHFAEIDENNIVLRVLVVSNDEEHRGQEFLAEDLGLGGTWIQTSYNDHFRKQFAGPGYIYDPVNDVFLTPQPFDSWVLNDNFDWVPPVPKPKDQPKYGIYHTWNEDTISWDQVIIENGDN